MNDYPIGSHVSFNCDGERGAGVIVDKLEHPHLNTVALDKDSSSRFGWRSRRYGGPSGQLYWNVRPQNMKLDKLPGPKSFKSILRNKFM